MLDPAHLREHPILLWSGVGICVWISLSIMVRIWFVHRKASLPKKLVWSFIVWVPIFGWLFYAAFFQVPSVTDTPAPREHSIYRDVGQFP